MNNQIESQKDGDYLKLKNNGKKVRFVGYSAEGQELYEVEGQHLDTYELKARGLI